ncbi:MAG: DNA-binding response regulator [Nonomuraea sp.]|nr:DNA-binding response regulator [Nonomuraea sp.]
MVRSPADANQQSHVTTCEMVRDALAESAFYAARGIRPPAQVVEASKVGVMIRRLVAATRRELLTFDDPSGCVSQGVSERLLANAADSMRLAVATVPAVRQITSPHGLAHDSGLDTIQWRTGSQARVVGRIPFRLAVFDRAAAVLALDQDVFFNGMLLVRDPAVVAALARSHRNAWNSGDDPATRDACEPPAYLVPILACMHDGLSDHAAAARLGLSPRTYARRVSELLALLGTTSRFQAGIIAHRRGWL